MISKAPKVLLIHLQRMVFNLDTFINEKLSTKHSFPNSFNLYPYTLQYIENSALESKKTDKEEKEEASESREEQSQDLDQSDK